MRWTLLTCAIHEVALQPDKYELVQMEGAHLATHRYVGGSTTVLRLTGPTSWLISPVFDMYVDESENLIGRALLASLSLDPLDPAEDSCDDSGVAATLVKCT